MKEKNNKINIKICILILLIILLLSSTYAWFTTNKNVRVETLNVQVATAGDLEISVDAINWKTEITSKELLEGIHSTYAGAVNQIPDEGLYPTSTTGIINNGKIDMFFGQVLLNKEANTYNLTASKEEETHGVSGKFITFDIFLRVAEDTTIYLNSNSSIESEFIDSPNNSTGIENATRIAFLNHGTASNATAAQNLKGATQAIILEPNYDVHTTTGIQNAERFYGISGLNKTGNNALSYYGVKSAITTGRPINDKSNEYFSLVNPSVKLEKSFFGSGTKREIFKLKEGITKVRLYLWIEGQDVDCEDNASGANLKFNLQFTT